MIITTDPHGCFLTFKKLHEDMTAKFPGEPFVVAGDLPDRGPRTRELIQYIIDNKITCIKGNHDDFMSDDKQEGLWLYNGGLKAYASYRSCPDGLLYPHPGETVINRAHTCEGIEVLKKHQEYIKALPLYLEYEELKHKNGRHLLITHAPVGQGHLENQVKKFGWDGQTFIWNRYKPPRKNVKNWYNVHGHTPQQSGPDIQDWYANIDTGCAYKGITILGDPLRPYYGKLTALRFPEMEIYQQENID
jgi:hypothetical protein